MEDVQQGSNGIDSQSSTNPTNSQIGQQVTNIDLSERTVLSTALNALSLPQVLSANATLCSKFFLQ